MTIDLLFPEHPNCQSAYQYCLDICGGKIPTCTLVKLACQRFLDDLERDNTTDIFPYVFDADKAERACKFIQLLPLTKGKWVTKKENLKLEPWQKFFICNLFGWVHVVTSLRRFREAYLELPRKNGKSALAAAIAVYIFCTEDDYAPEIYVGATSEKQAGEIFVPIKKIVEKTPKLVARYGLKINAETITMPESGGKIERVIAKPGDGASPVMFILDELHEHKSDAQFSTAVTGMGARQQPLLLSTTTAGFDTSSFCYEKHQECVRVLTGVEKAERLLPFIFALDEEDDWKDLNNVIKVNPNYKISIFEDGLRAQHADALRNPAKQNAFLTKHCNVWMNAASAFFNFNELSKAEDGELNEADFIAQDLPCVAGLDLASKLDFAAFARVYTKVIDSQNHYYAFVDLYLPQRQVIESSNSGIYSKWLIEDYFTQCDGVENDFMLIKERIKEFKFREIAYDPYNSSTLLQVLEQEQHEVLAVEMAQNVKNLSPALRELEAALASERFHFKKNPVLMWMFQNVNAKEDKNGNVFPFKSNANSKIDGAAAVIMAVGRSAVPLEVTEDIWAKYGVRTL